MTDLSLKPELTKARSPRTLYPRANPASAILAMLVSTRFLLPTSGFAAEFLPFSGDAHSSFGTKLSISGSTALAGASGVAVYHGHTPYYSQGAAYGIANLNTANSPTMFKFTANDGAA